MLSTAIGSFAILISVSCWPVDADAGLRRSTLPTIPNSRSSRSLNSKDRDFGQTWAPTAPGGRSFRARNTGHSGYSTDNRESIQRFWSHYHGARSNSKRKPLEREK
jgi:hypothetical protein